MGQCQGRAHLPAQSRFSRHPYLAPEPPDQIPYLPAVISQRLVQSRGAVRALRLTGLTVVFAPAEVPVSKGAEPFFPRPATCCG